MEGERVPIRLDHVGVVVTDLAAATAFFVELGLAVDGKAAVGGEWVDRVIGLAGVQSDIVMLETPDGHGRIELSRFRSPQAPGVRWCQLSGPDRRPYARRWADMQMGRAHA
jgi:catechol 2,3-dioxygenase-like lactoylglutathione lyase family enzyme